MNDEPKFFCVFVVDIKDEIGKSGKYNNAIIIKSFLQELHENIAGDPISSNRLVISIVAGRNEILNGVAYDTEIPVLLASQKSSMVSGVRKAIEIVDGNNYWHQKTKIFRPSCPLIILISDGNYDGDQDIDGLVRDIEEKTKENEFMFLTIATNEANMDVLQKIAGYAKGWDGKFARMCPRLDIHDIHSIFKIIKQCCIGFERVS